MRIIARNDTALRHPWAINSPLEIPSQSDFRLYSGLGNLAYHPDGWNGFWVPIENVDWEHLLRFSGSFQTSGGLHGIYIRPSLAVTMKAHSLRVVQPDVQRRSAVRYKLQLPVIFHWRDGEERTQGGFTCDVARDGALIRTGTCPPIGSEVRIEVLVPSPERGGQEVRVQCIGVVTRITVRDGILFFRVEGGLDDDWIIERARE